MMRDTALIVPLVISTYCSDQFLSLKITQFIVSTHLQGFVVPETPSDPMLTWIPGSGCTLPCKTNMFSAEEWKGTFLITKTMSSLGFPMITLMLFVWCLDKQKRKQYLIIWFAVFSFILSISFVIIAGMNDSGNDTYCKDNASRFNQKTGTFHLSLIRYLKFFFSVCSHHLISYLFDTLFCK